MEWRGGRFCARVLASTLATTSTIRPIYVLEKIVKWDCVGKRKPIVSPDTCISAIYTCLELKCRSRALPMGKVMQTKKPRKQPAQGGVEKTKAKTETKTSAAVAAAAKAKTPKAEKKETKDPVAKKAKASEEIDGLFGQLKGAAAKKAKVGGRDGAIFDAPSLKL